MKGDTYRSKIAEKQAALQIAKEKLKSTPHPGPKPPEPEILTEHAEAQTKVTALLEERITLAADRQRMENEIESLRGVTICPMCGASGTLEKAMQRVEMALAPVIAAIAKIDSDVASILEPFADVKSIFAQYEEAVSEYQSALDAHEDAESAVAELTDGIANIEVALKGVEADRGTRIAELNAELESMPSVSAEVDRLRAQTQAWKDYQNIVSDRDAREQEVLREECTVAVMDAAIKAVNKIVSGVAENAFASVLKLSRVFTDGLLQSPLQFSDGELGCRAADGGWIPHESFSGTEQLLAYAGFSVALARTAPFRLVVLDELGRLTIDRRLAVVERMLELVKENVVDQVLMIDATMPGTIYGPKGKDVVDALYKRKGIVHLALD